jgi:hypothetical protein
MDHTGGAASSDLSESEGSGSETESETDWEPPRQGVCGLAWGGTFW